MNSSFTTPSAARPSTTGSLNKIKPLLLALNPCIDVEWRVDHVRWEEKNSVLSERRWAGGKGVNVFRWLHYLSQPRSSRRQEALTSLSLSPSEGERARERGPTLRLAPPNLLLPLGGQTGAELARSLRNQKLRFRVVRLREATRVNVIITTAAIRQLRFNPLGPKLSRSEWKSLLATTKRSLADASSLVLSGSLPRGVPATAYAELVKLARAFGVKTLLDCDGEALAAAVKARPFLVKPNEHELAQWRGKPLRSESAIAQAARELSGVTQGWVLVSRGPRRSLLLNQPLSAEFLAQPPRVAPLNTVGAGDALLAAVAWQIDLGAPPEEWLRWGVVAGTAATQCAAGHLPARGLITTITCSAASAQT